MEKPELVVFDLNFTSRDCMGPWAGCIDYLFERE